MNARNQRPTFDLTQPGELNAIPWDDVTEKEQFSAALGLAMCDVDLSVASAEMLPGLGAGQMQAQRSCTIRMDFLDRGEKVWTEQYFHWHSESEQCVFECASAPT
jgi:hypothetical protein